MAGRAGHDVGISEGDDGFSCSRPRRCRSGSGPHRGHFFHGGGVGQPLLDVLAHLHGDHFPPEGVVLGHGHEGATDEDAGHEGKVEQLFGREEYLAHSASR